MLYLIIGGFGLMVGSFLNVCIYRLPQDKSVVWPGSRCPKCRHPVRWFDNIPVLSFLILGARCRDCRTRISWVYPAVETTTALGIIFAVYQWGLTPYGVMAAILISSFIVVSLIDIRHQIIPDQISLGGIAIGVIFSVFYPGWHGTETPAGGFIGSVVGLFAGGGVLFLAGTLGEWIFKKEAMGGGDVKLLAAIGAFLGWQGVFITLVLASLVGSVIGGGVKLIKGHERIPFGPFLVAGAFLHMLLGDMIIAWYVKNVLLY